MLMWCYILVICSCSTKLVTKPGNIETKVEGVAERGGGGRSRGDWG